MGEEACRRLRLESRLSGGSIKMRRSLHYFLLVFPKSKLTHPHACLPPLPPGMATFQPYP